MCGKARISRDKSNDLANQGRLLSMSCSQIEMALSLMFFETGQRLIIEATTEHAKGKEEEMIGHGHGGRRGILKKVRAYEPPCRLHAAWDTT